LEDGCCSAKDWGARWVYLKSGTTKHAAADSKSKKDRPDFDALHKDLVGEHAHLTKGLSDFVGEFGFEDIEKSNIGKLLPTKS
jgi:hypothetical protein